jgi:D-sedoheptulose 7-phosphate isomerase
MVNGTGEAAVHDALLDLSRLASTVAETMPAQIIAAADIIGECLSSGGKVLACGNGGSAADAQHMVAELIGRFLHERSSLPAIALSSDPSIVTALGNDYGFDQVFARQVEGLGRPGDVLLGISTSGRSANVLKAVKVAQQRGMRTLALLGAEGNPMFATCAVCLHIPAHSTPRIQEIHMAILHAICAHVEQALIDMNSEPGKQGV